MVDLGNRLTTKLLDVGMTSMTIYVEWPLDMEFEEEWFHLMGKLDIEERGWHYLTFLEVDPTQGKATFEVRYAQLSWYYPDDSTNEFKDFKKKAFYAIRVAIPPKDPEGIFRGKYEEDDETGDLSKAPLIVTTVTAEVQETKTGRAQVSPSNREGEEKLGIRNEELGEEELGIEKQETPNRLWLYVGVIFFLSVVFYFLRKKKP